jgi:hypothetical protein
LSSLEALRLLSRIALFAAALVTAGNADAQVTDFPEILEAFRRDQVELYRYTWTSRTEISLDGEVQEVRVFQAHLDPDGNVEKFPLPADSGSTHGRGVKRSQAKNEALERELVELIKSYTEMSPGQMQAVLSKAATWEGAGSTTQIRARSVVHQGDSVDIGVDRESLRLERLEILTALAGEPVQLTVEFGRLDDGTGHVARTTLNTEIKERKLVIQTVNADYVKR